MTATACRRYLSVHALWLGLLAGALAAPVGGQLKSIRFTRLNTDHGLSQADVHAILQDRRGFIWLATQDGLNRFDGYGFRVYRHDSFDDTSLSHNFVYSIVEDESGDLWVGTGGGGLNRWNAQLDAFSHYRSDPSNPNSLSNDRIRVMIRDQEGFLWIGTDGGGLNRFDPKTETFTRYIHNPAKPDSLSNDRILKVYQDRGGILWVGTDGGGLNRFDRETERFEPLVGTGTPISETARVRAIYEDRAGQLWIGTYEEGLFRYVASEGRIDRFLSDPDDAASLSSNRVRAIFQDSMGTLWVGTDNGLNEWDPVKQTFARYQNDPGDAASLSDNRVVTIFQDRGGLLWFGTQGGGVSRWSPRSGFFASFQSNPALPDSLSTNAIAAFSEAANGNVYVGTYGGGVNVLDREAGRFVHYTHDPDRPTSLSDDRVMSLLVDSAGVLWVGTLERGLNRLDSSDGRFTRFVHDPQDPTSLARNGVVTLIEGIDGYLWLGTWGGGLNRFDRKAGTFVHYRHDPENPASISSDRVTALHEEPSGVLWVGTETDGLSRFDRNTGSFTTYRHDPAHQRSLSSDSIYSLFHDSREILWVGTQSGLNRWEPGLRGAYKGVFTRYTERDGLPNNSIYGIQEDAEGNLWISSNKGLSRFDPGAETFKNFNVAHGLLSNEFNFGAHFRHSSGEMYFGGNKGFNSFFPDRVGTNPYIPPVVLTSFLKFNQAVQLDQPVSEVDAITLSHRDYVVSFEFSALDFTAPERNRYAYKLEGFDTDWIEIGNIRRATYTNLDSGDYLFRVRGANNDGIWNGEGLQLKVSVVPPPWKTWWAYGLYGLAAVLVFFAYTEAQRKKLEREAVYSRKLEQEVQARTRELAEKNDTLEFVNKKLEEASVTDSLTGLRNRRFLLTSIQNDIGLVERFYTGLETAGQTPAVVKPDFLFLIFDLDGFKEVNDTYGHAAGDLVLVQVRDLLHRACRESDTLIRWGGDEFLVVGRTTDQQAAEGLAERIRETVAAHRFDVGTGHRVLLSCSIGFAGYPFVPSKPTRLHWEQVVGIADRALYIAKQSGRNEWVGIFGTERAADVPTDNLVTAINDRPEVLAEEGLIQLRTSIPDHQAVVWARA